MTSDLKRISHWQATKLVYTVEEAAELLSLSRAQLYRLIEVGDLPSIKIGRARRVSADQLHVFIRRLEALAPTDQIGPVTGSR